MTGSVRKFDFRSKLTHKQTLAWDALARIDVKEVLYGGAKGGGKSVFGCLWCFEKAIDIIKQCAIGPRKHPIPVGFMGRKRGVDFTNTTLETWKRFIPEGMYEIKGKPAEEKTSKNHYVLDTGGARCYNSHRCESGSSSGSTQMRNIGQGSPSGLSEGPLQAHAQLRSL